MERNEIPQLAVNHPSRCPIRILALDTKHSFVSSKGMQTVTDPNTQAVEQHRYPPMSFLIALEPQLQHQSGQVPSDELVRDIDDCRLDGRLSGSGLLTGLVSDRGEE